MTMKDIQKNLNREMALAERIQQACIEAAKEGFRDASMQGLCTDGAMEAAVSAIEMVDIEKIIGETDQAGS